LTVAAVGAAVVGADVLEVITGLLTSFVMELGMHKKTQAGSAAITYAVVL
jgi:hypothetical protein